MNTSRIKPDTKKLYCILAELARTEEARRMRNYIQHGSVTTYEHCIRVAIVSYLINQKFRLGADVPSLVRGAFLHDFYLYDWHDRSRSDFQRFHGFHHPAKALANAERYYTLNDRERNIIRSHMWPLTITSVPCCREAVIVCIADKWCSTHETLFHRKK